MLCCEIEVTAEAEDIPRLMFIMPWARMVESAKDMIDVAHQLVRMNRPVSFVLTMSFLYEGERAELSLTHE